MKLRSIPGITKGAAPLVSRYVQVVAHPKGRVIQGLPIAEATLANRALSSLVTDFPLPTIPEDLWGRSKRREMPMCVLVKLTGYTIKAWKVHIVVECDGNLLIEKTETWFPKGHVFLWAHNHPNYEWPWEQTYTNNGQLLFRAYGGLHRMWVPMWLYRRKQLDLPAEQRVQSSRS